MEPLAQYQYTGASAVLRFTIREKEYTLTPGQNVYLPSGNLYVTGLVAGGQLTKVAAEDAGESATNETANVAEKPAVETAENPATAPAPDTTKKPGRS